MGAFDEAIALSATPNTLEDCYYHGLAASEVMCEDRLIGEGSRRNGPSHLRMPKPHASWTVLAPQGPLARARFSSSSFCTLSRAWTPYPYPSYSAWLLRLQSSRPAPSPSRRLPAGAFLPGCPPPLPQYHSPCVLPMSLSTPQRPQVLTPPLSPQLRAICAPVS